MCWYSTFHRIERIVLVQNNDVIMNCCCADGRQQRQPWVHHSHSHCRYWRLLCRCHCHFRRRRRRQNMGICFDHGTVLYQWSVWKNKPHYFNRFSKQYFKRYLLMLLNTILRVTFVRCQEVSCDTMHGGIRIRTSCCHIIYRVTEEKITLLCWLYILLNYS